MKLLQSLGCLAILNIILFTSSTLLLALRRSHAHWARKNMYWLYKTRLNLIYGSMLFTLLWMPLSVPLCLSTLLSYQEISKQLATFAAENSLTLLSIGVATDIFLAVQVPTLLRPEILVTMLLGIGKTYDTKDVKKLALEPKEKRLVIFQIACTGFNFYRNCCVWIGFQLGFEILDHKSDDYKDLSFPKKKFLIQRQGNTAYFPPTLNYQGITPTNTLALPLVIIAPEEEGCYPVSVSLSCETRFDEVNDRSLQIEVKRLERKTEGVYHSPMVK